MSKYIIIRIGIPVPTREEINLIRRISTDETQSAGAPLIPPHSLKNIGTSMSGMISLISSDLTPNEIAQEFDKISTENDDDVDFDEKESFPVFVFKIDEEHFAYNKDLSSYLGFGQMIQKLFGISHATEEEEGRVNSLSLNDILDLMIEKGGYENLSEEEKVALAKFKS